MTAPAISFVKAVRNAVKLKLGIQGPSGSGKTLGALLLARAIVGPSGRIAVVDTENETASLYSDRVEFDTLSIKPPYLSSKFEQAILAAAAAEYDIVVLDSISHQWMGEGGILFRKEALDKQGGSSFNNWATFTPEQEKFKAAISNAPIHLIATLRSKMEYVVEENARGKSVPKKVGMAPIQREGMEYEFSVVFELQMSHRASVSKDRTDLFASADTLYDLADPKIGKKITEWLKTAKPLPTREEIAAQAERILRDTTRVPGTEVHFDGYGGKLLREVPQPALDKILVHLRDIDIKGAAEGRSAKYAEVIEAIGLVTIERHDAAEAEAAVLAAATATTE